MKRNTTPTIDPETNDVMTNQTWFSEEEPLFENAGLPSMLTEEELQARDKKEKIQQRNIKIAVVVGLLLFVSLASLAVLKPKKKLAIITPPSTTSQSTVVPSEGLKKRIDEAQQDFQDADPTQVSLPLPPVKTDIYLDAPQR